MLQAASDFAAIAGESRDFSPVVFTGLTAGQYNVAVFGLGSDGIVGMPVAHSEVVTVGQSGGTGVVTPTANPSGILVCFCFVSGFLKVLSTLVAREQKSTVMLTSRFLISPI